jgi:hypothetical protein
MIRIGDGVGAMIDATPLLRGYARWRLARLARQDAAAEQQRQLLRLVQAAAPTRFGRDHGFAGIRTVADFQARVPLRRYEELWSRYWQPDFPRLVDCTWPGTVPFFALTSGTTTGTTKYIPCTHAMNRANAWAAIDTIVHHLGNRPHSRVGGGKSFMLGGSTALTELARGIRGGDLSGIVASEIPRWARAWSFPPPDLALIADWEAKVERLARAAPHEDIRAISGTPSWLLVFFERLFALHPQANGRLHGVFPNLELLVHGGVGFSPYRRQFEQLLAGGHAELCEVYPASEGFFAIADRAPGEGMRLLVDNGLFHEFVPVDEIQSDQPTRHWLGNAEPGVDYALVVSSCAGLWSCIVGDTVRFVGLRPPRVLVTGRLSYFLSAFGEHLSGEEIEAAIGTAAQKIGAEISEYSVGARFPDAASSRGWHLYIVEFAGPIPAAPALHGFVETLDAELLARNDDYAAHRSGGFGMDAPELLVVGHGAFKAWMKHRGQLGGQHKVPRVIADPALFDALRQFMAEHCVTG